MKIKLNKKQIIWGSIGLVVLLIVLSKVFGGGKEITEVTVQEIQLRDITEIVSVTGKIQPEKEVKISPDVSGEITEMFIKEGDSVVKGQLLLRINPELYESNLNQMLANLDNAKAALSGSEAQELRAKTALILAESNFKRQQKLYDQKVISEQEWENVRLQYEQQKTEAVVAAKNKLAAVYNVRSLDARLDEVRKTLGRTSIYAPESGIVTQLNSEKGERVVGTAQMAGTEMMRISNLNSMEVEVNINENDVVRVHKGDIADVRVDAYPDRTFKGVVTEIANSAKFNAAQNMTEQVTNYVVKIRLDRESYADLITSQRKNPFLPGMTASADIRTLSKKQVVALPIAALTNRNPYALLNDENSSPVESNSTVKTTDNKGYVPGKTYVFVLENNKAKAVEVATGIQDIDYFEVTKGLKAGDKVISEPAMAIAKTLIDGEIVKVSGK
jgi:HlyD family secretion protein